MLTAPVGLEICRPGLAGLFPASLAAGYGRQHSPWAGKAAWVLQGSASGRQISSPEPIATQNEGLRDSTPVNKSNQRQLSMVYAQLRDELPSFFHADMDYSVYHPSVRFEESVTSLHIRFNGLKTYRRMMDTIRKATLFCFPDVQLNIMSITKHPDQMEIRVRWQTVATRWSAKVYLDAYSIFKVDDTGAIVEHKCNKVMQDYQFVPQRRPLFWSLLGLSNQPAGPMPACSTPPRHLLACDF